MTINQADYHGLSLPVIQVENRFYGKDCFLGLLRDLLSLEAGNLEEKLAFQKMIASCAELQKCANYFIYFHKKSRANHHDPYSLFFQPLMKLRHFLKIKNIYHLLHQSGINSKETALSVAQRCLNDLDMFYAEHFSHRQGVLILYMISCFLREIEKCIPGTELNHLLNEKHSQLVSNCRILRLEIAENSDKFTPQNCQKIFEFGNPF